MYRELTAGLIRKYGREFVVLPHGTDNEIKVKAIVNPLLYKNKMYIGGTYLPDGFCDGGHYLYIGEPRVSLSDLPLGTVVRRGDDEYSIKHAEQYFIDGNPLYSWAVLQLRKRGGA